MVHQAENQIQNEKKRNTLYLVAVILAICTITSGCLYLYFTKSTSLEQKVEEGDITVESIYLEELCGPREIKDA